MMYSVHLFVNTFLAVSNILTTQLFAPQHTEYMLGLNSLESRHIPNIEIKVCLFVSCLFEDSSPKHIILIRTLTLNMLDFGQGAGTLQAQWWNGESKKEREKWQTNKQTSKQAPLRRTWLFMLFGD